jgi:hypothetical protein
MPSHVAAFRATGEVTKQDYETVVVPLVDAVTTKHGHIHFLLVLETNVSNITLGAWWEDILMGLKKFTKWKKIAIVSPQEWVDKFSTVFSALVPGESKGFAPDEMETAKVWVASE